MFRLVRVYANDSLEYQQLKIAAEMLTRKSRSGYKYRVETVCYDAKQNWLWTTIVCHTDTKEYPALTLERQMNVVFTNNMDFTTDCILNDA